MCGHSHPGDRSSTYPVSRCFRILGFSYFTAGKLWNLSPLEESWLTRAPTTQLQVWLQTVTWKRLGKTQMLLLSDEYSKVQMICFRLQICNSVLFCPFLSLSYLQRKYWKKSNYSCFKAYKTIMCLADNPHSRSQTKSLLSSHILGGMLFQYLKHWIVLSLLEAFSGPVMHQIWCSLQDCNRRKRKTVAHPMMSSIGGSRSWGETVAHLKLVKGKDNLMGGENMVHPTMGLKIRSRPTLDSLRGDRKSVV